MRVSYPADQQELEATASRLEGRKGVRYVIASSQEVGAETVKWELRLQRSSVLLEVSGLKGRNILVALSFFSLVFGTFHWPNQAGN